MSAASEMPWRKSDGTVTLRVRLTPKGGRDCVEGVIATPDGPALKARVRTAPENGAANDALIISIAAWLDVPRSSISLVAGHKSRTKMLAIVGDPAIIERGLAAAILRHDGRAQEERS